MPRAVFVDTWGWLALGHRRDAHHSSVKRWYRRLRRNRTKFYTSDYVLDELISLLFRREHFDEAVRFLEGLFAGAVQGQLTIERITSERFAKAWTLRRKFRDKPSISFTDLSSMAIMKEFGVTDVLTDDDHFHQVGMGFQKAP